MECPHCNKQGISALKKSLMLCLGTPLRCTQCGSLFKFNKGFAFLIVLALELMIVLSIVWGLQTTNANIMWLAIFAGVAMIHLIGTILPLKIESQLTYSTTRNKNAQRLSWHFWFLHSLTIFALFIGYFIGVENDKPIATSLSFGALVYFSPLLLFVTRNMVPKALLVKFYRKSR